MNEAHWHLVINHFPLILPIVGFLVMLGGLISKSEILKRTAFIIFIVAAMTAILAYNTGEGAEEIIEGMQGIDESYIQAHEESAEIYLILIYIIGGLSLIGLWLNWKKKSFSRGFEIFSLLFSVLVLFYAQRTGTTGGEIRHSEIRSESSLKIDSQIYHDEHEEDEDD
jgi:uncharacterized membrane protein